MLQKIINKFRKIILINRINIVNKCNISLKANIDNLSQFEGRNLVYPMTTIGKSEIGFATYISSSCSFYKTKIGRYCSIGANVKVIAGNHPTSKYISSHPIFYNNKGFSGLYYESGNLFNEYSYTNENESFLCEIGNDVWIGESVKILNGICIGDGAIIGTGSVVTKHIPPYSIVGGVPAKLIRYRFTEEEINYLLKLKWWNKDEDWIRYNINLFSDVKLLMEDEK